MLGGESQDSAALREQQDLLKNLHDWNAAQEHIDVVSREIERLRASDDFEVHEDNWEAVNLFIDLGTQWRVVGTFGGKAFLGLDYTAVDAVLRLRRVHVSRRASLFEDLRTMEDAALVALAKREAAAHADVATTPQSAL